MYHSCCFIYLCLYTEPNAINFLEKTFNQLHLKYIIITLNVDHLSGEYVHLVSSHEILKVVYLKE